LIDTEGNGEQCMGMPEIPEFLYAPTKNVAEVIDLIDQVTAGKLKFPDGSPVETLCVDSYTILWSVRQEVGSLAAENRAQRYGKSKDEANMTQLDWVLAKRPLKQLNTRINNSPIRFIVFIAREKDLYREKPGGRKDELVKDGVCPDVIKGTDYDVNLILHLGWQGENKWQATVEKVQGALGKIMPKGKVLTTFPAKELIEYASHMTATAGSEKGEVETAEESLKKEGPVQRPTTPAGQMTEALKQERQEQGNRALERLAEKKQAFIKAAMEAGYKTDDGRPDMTAIAAVLKPMKMWPYDPAKHDDALTLLKSKKVPAVPFAE
jgi:hypothetical protein